MKVGQSEAANRRTQKRKPGHAIGRPQDRERQSMQVANDLALAERLDIDRAKRNLRGLQGANDFRQVGSGANQDGDAIRGMLLALRP